MVWGWELLKYRDKPHILFGGLKAYPPEIIDHIYCAFFFVQL